MGNKYFNRGVFDYYSEDNKKSSKKEIKKEQERKLREQAERTKKMCECNHIARNNSKNCIKCVDEENHIFECKICHSTLIDINGIGMKEIEDVVTMIHSIISFIRINDTSLSEEDDEKLVKMNKTLHKLNTYYESAKKVREANMYRDEDGGSKKKKKKNKDNPYRSFKRIQY